MERDLLPVSLLNYDLFIFDLDNTLYAEQDYLFGAYDEIAKKLGGELSKTAISNFLKESFIKNGRTNLFDSMLAQFKLEASAMQTALTILRKHKPESKYILFNTKLQLLQELKKKDKKLTLLTNGNVAQQKNKIANLTPDLTQIFDMIVYANTIEPKPSPKGVQYILANMEIANDKSVFIGDSITDKQAAESAGIDYIDINELPGHTNPSRSGD